MTNFVESRTSMFEMCKQDGTSIDKCFIVACSFVTRGWCWHYVCGLNTRLSVNTERASDPLAWLQKLDFTFIIYSLGLNVCSSNNESCMLESCCILCTTLFPRLVFFCFVYFWFSFLNDHTLTISSHLSLSFFLCFNVFLLRSLSFSIYLCLVSSVFCCSLVHSFGRFFFHPSFSVWLLRAPFQQFPWPPHAKTVQQQSQNWRTVPTTSSWSTS